MSPAALRSAPTFFQWFDTCWRTSHGTDKAGSLSGRLLANFRRLSSKIQNQKTARERKGCLLASALGPPLILTTLISEREKQAHMVSVAPGHMFAWGLGTDSGIFWKYRHNGPYTTGWTAWATEGGKWLEDPVVASRGLGEAAIFLVDAHRALHHANYNFMKDNGVSPFKNIGGKLSGPPAVGNRNGTLHITYIGSDHMLYHKSWNGTKYTPEDTYEKLGGLFIYSPAVVSAGADEVSVFAVGLTDGRLHHYHWKSNSGWEPSGGDLKGAVEGQSHVGTLPGLWVGTPCAISAKAGTWDVFGVNAEGNINHLSYSHGRLSELEVISGQGFQTVDAISIAPGTIDLFAWGLDSGVSHKNWNSTTWTEWENLHGVTIKRPSPVSDAAGVLCVMVVGVDCVMYINIKKGAGKWSGWNKLQGTLISRIG